MRVGIYPSPQVLDLIRNFEYLNIGIWNLKIWNFHLYSIGIWNLKILEFSKDTFPPILLAGS